MVTKNNFFTTLTFKGISIVILSLLLLIPNGMIQNLISERQGRSVETIEKINDKWSRSQTLCAPVLIIPYTITTMNENQKEVTENHSLYITPKVLNIDAGVIPEERHYGIYKAILYKSNVHLSGNFSELADLKIEKGELHFDKAMICIGVTDLRGITQNPVCLLNGKSYETTVDNVDLFSVREDQTALNSRGNSYATYSTVQGKTLVVKLEASDSLQDVINFDCTLALNGSSSLSFIPVGDNSAISLSGKWQSPSFIGNFSPESTIENGTFEASWNILGFNREIPKMWTDEKNVTLGSDFVGVNLIETVDQYQQNMRSSKYALMFIVLTFMVFFFVEIFTEKKIRVFQYALVGVALILFYSLLLSLSEQIGFGWAYLIAAFATIGMTAIYFYSIVKQRSSTIILAAIMSLLYLFLYVILQIEDFALLFGSIFLFIVLGVIMFASNKIKFERQKSVKEEKE